MRVLIERDDGAILEAREIESVPPGADTLLFFTRYALRRTDQEQIEQELSGKIGKRCIILPRYVEKVAGT